MGDRGKLYVGKLYADLFILPLTMELPSATFLTTHCATSTTIGIVPAGILLPVSCGAHHLWRVLTMRVRSLAVPFLFTRYRQCTLTWFCMLAVVQLGSEDHLA